MSAGRKRSLTLSIEANSEEELDKLLEMAVFELAQARKLGSPHHLLDREDGEVVSFELSGTMGGYKLLYALGCPEIVELRNQLLTDGYQLATEPDWVLGRFAVYAHPDGREMRLHINPPAITEHDPSEPTPF